MGGSIEVPRLQLHMRLDDETAEYLGEELRRRYEAGHSIRDIANETTYSNGRVRSLLHRANTSLRPRGAQPSVPAECEDLHKEPLQTTELIAG